MKFELTIEKVINNGVDRKNNRNVICNGEK